MARLLSWWLVVLVVLVACACPAASVESAGRPGVAKSSASARTTQTVAAPANTATTPNPTGKETVPQIQARRAKRRAKLAALGSTAKIRTEHTRADLRLSTSAALFQNVVTESKVNVKLSQAGLMQFHRQRVRVALLNAATATVANPAPFSASGALSLMGEHQFKTLHRGKKGKKKLPVGLKAPTKPKLPPVHAGTTAGKANAKAHPGAAATAPAGKANAKAATAPAVAPPAASKKAPKRKSLLQLHARRFASGRLEAAAGAESESESESDQSPRTGAGGVASGAGIDGSASGRKGGDTGSDGSASGRKGGDTGGDGSASGRKGGDVGDNGSASGRKGGAMPSPLPSGGIANAGVPAGGAGAADPCNPPRVMNANQPGYVKQEGDVVAADGSVTNRVFIPQVIHPITGKCYTPTMTWCEDGLIPGHCPVCKPGTNPMYQPVPNPNVPRRLWPVTMVEYEADGTPCYGPNCFAASRLDINIGALIIPFRPVMVNGHLQDGSPNLKDAANGKLVTIYQRDQGDGSTCWANAAVILTEIAQQSYTVPNSQSSYFNGPLSVKTIVQCVPNEGAGGGSPIDALQWLTTHVLPMQSQVVQLVGLQPCPPAVPNGQATIDVVVTPIPTCISGDCAGQAKFEPQLATALLKTPLLAYVDASNWQSWRPGGDPVTMLRCPHCAVPPAYVFPESQCSSKADLGDHIVIINEVYTDGAGQQFYRILNSWGRDWGVTGYIYLRVGVNACGVANYPVGIQPFN